MKFTRVAGPHLFFFMALMLALSGTTYSQDESEQKVKVDKFYSQFNQEEQILCGYAPGQAEQVRAAIPENWTIIENYTEGNFFICKRPVEMNRATITKLVSTPSIKYLEPNTIITLDPPDKEKMKAQAKHLYHHHQKPHQCIPNDPSMNDLWGMKNIHAPQAWCCVRNSKVIVAVIDTGIDYQHEDLADNIWTNTGEIPGDGIDNDKNGFIDDIHGYDFVNNDGDPMDDNVHGTHVAGTIGAVGNNKKGVVGVNWSAQIMAVKFLNKNGSGYLSDAIKAIAYARENGAWILNNSWGGGGYSQAMADEITRVEEAHLLFVAAAGNSGMNTDQYPHYPSSYLHPNIISVASIDEGENRSYFSNYGKYSVDIAAPGSNILSTLPGNRYGRLSGTSMATPHVSGAAALLWYHPDFRCSSWKVIKNKLLCNARSLDTLKDKCLTEGTLDIGFLCPACECSCHHHHGCHDHDCCHRNHSHHYCR